MALDDLKSAIPDYAKDLKLNLGSVIGNSDLPAAAALGHRAGLRHRLALAAACCASWSPRPRPTSPPEAYTAAKSAAAVMAMNNVFYRTRHLLSDPEYGNLRAGLRMNVIGNPGVEKVDFELWSLAVSAINGCGQCLDSHEQVLRKAGVDRETIQEAVKIAPVIQARRRDPRLPRPSSPSSHGSTLTRRAAERRPTVTGPCSYVGGHLPAFPRPGLPTRPASSSAAAEAAAAGRRRRAAAASRAASGATKAVLPARTPAQVADHRVGHRDQRDGDDRAADARDMPPAATESTTAERVDPDGAAEDEAAAGCGPRSAARRAPRAAPSAR